MNGLTGQHALVTGGTSGIGAAIAAALAAAGCRVTVTGLTQGEVDDWARRRPADALGLPLDVSDRAQVARVVGGLSRLDALVNCAGTIRRAEEYDPDVFATVVGVNLVGTMAVSVACRPLLAARGGSIVNIASMLSVFGAPHAPGYSASKGGVVQLTKSFAVAWAADGIRVNALAPGWIETPLTKALREDPVRSETILARTPMRRFGRPEDVAGAAVFLCSPAAAFITGVVLPVDGGYSSV